MGKGLSPAITGTHIAFAAGTGCLCFVDLVAHIALVLLCIEEGSIDPANFTFHLYLSFPKRSEAIAYELCEALHNYCQQK